LLSIWAKDTFYERFVLVEALLQRITRTNKFYLLIRKDCLD
jgi:hypothetical protein